MSEPAASEDRRAKDNRQVTVQLGRLRLTGARAVAALAGGLALIVALVAYLAPSVTPSPLWLSAALWILFIGYWNRAATGAAPTAMSESRASRRVHERLMTGALLLLFLPLPGLRARFVPDAPFIVAIGLGVHVGSILLAVWARRHLGRYWSGAIAVKVEHQLIRTGPYRVLRHPIYSAMLGMFVGTALVSGALHALLAVGIMAGAYWRKIRLEERYLRETFGPMYDDYCRTASALIPGVF